MADSVRWDLLDGSKRVERLQSTRCLLESTLTISNEIKTLSEPAATWPDLAASLFEKLTWAAKAVVQPWGKLVTDKRALLRAALKGNP